jgi:hypothetical protein
MWHLLTYCRRCLHICFEALKTGMYITERQDLDSSLVSSLNIFAVMDLWRCNRGARRYQHLSILCLPCSSNVGREKPNVESPRISCNTVGWRAQKIEICSKTRRPAFPRRKLDRLMAQPTLGGAPIATQNPRLRTYTIGTD